MARPTRTSSSPPPTPRSTPPSAAARTAWSRAQPEPPQHEQRALADRAVARQQAELHGGVVDVVERAYAPQQLAARVELAVEDRVDRQRLARGRQPWQLAAVRAGDAARRRDVALVAQALAGPLQAGVGERAPQQRGVVGELVD